MYYLDNAATTWPKPECVYKALDENFRQMFSPKRGTAKAARMGADKLTEARQGIARMFNMANPERVIFTAGCTYSLNIAVHAFPWEKDDAVVISAVEHHALSRPIRKLAKEKGIRFHVVPYTDDMPFDLAACEQLLKTDSRIRMIATTHASNVIGSVMPVAEIGKLARQYGKTYLVDAAQTAGVLPVDVRAMNIDMLALPGHKSLYGPPGMGVLYVAEGVKLNTVFEGGTGNDSGKHDAHATVPDGFEVGTIALPQILALAEGVRWVEETGLEKIHRHETQLLAQLLEGLKQRPDVTIYGHTDILRKTPVVSFNVGNLNPKELGTKLFDEFGIALRAGFHCAPMAHEAIGTIARGGTIRASLGWFTKAEDVDALLSALKQVRCPA